MKNYCTKVTKLDPNFKNRWGDLFISKKEKIEFEILSLTDGQLLCLTRKSLCVKDEEVFAGATREFIPYEDGAIYDPQTLELLSDEYESLSNGNVITFHSYLFEYIDEDGMESLFEITDVGNGIGQYLPIDIMPGIYFDEISCMLINNEVVEDITSHDEDLLLMAWVDKFPDVATSLLGKA